MFNDEPVIIEEEIIDEDPFQEIPEEELQQDGIVMEPEQDLDQFVEKNFREILYYQKNQGNNSGHTTAKNFKKIYLANGGN